jgi:succinate dehydrogenase / fumarate reductase cytochrome b subunit
VGPALRMMQNLPVISNYGRTRGWAYVMAWGHRISGVILAGYLLLHIYTLSFLNTPALYDEKMKSFQLTLFTILEWALAIPMIFHALNGSRLILYEIFSFRDDESMIRWVFGLSFAYMVLLTITMIMGNQGVSDFLFWATVLVPGVCLGYLVASKSRRAASGVTWKLQRITGAFLLIMMTGHFMFMHLTPSVSHEASSVIARMENPLIKMMDLAFVLLILYHAGYGLISIAKDYIRSSIFKNLCTLLIILVMGLFAWIGLILTLSI